jgi:hypothetical protein
MVFKRNIRDDDEYVFVSNPAERFVIHMTDLEQDAAPPLLLVDHGPINGIRPSISRNTSQKENAHI